MFDTGLADRIRAKAAAWGLPVDVVEVADWRDRGREFPRRPTLYVGHHTANRNMGWAPSLGICINGRHDLPGPLCNGLRSRIRDGRYTLFVIAAGVANHAGKGGYAGHAGNSSAYGLEVENVGTAAEPWTELDQEVDALILAAMIEGAGTSGCEHKEWTQRKVDRHTLSGDTTRWLVAKYLGTPPQPEPPEDEVKEIHIPVDDAGNTHNPATGQPYGPQLAVLGNRYTTLTSQAEHEALVAAGYVVRRTKPFENLLNANQLLEFHPR